MFKSAPRTVDDGGVSVVLGSPPAARPTSADLVRLTRWSHLATAGLVVVMLAVTGFALWGSRTTSAAAADAVRADGLAQLFADAERAAGNEEALERKYLLEPSLTTRQRFDAAAGRVAVALRAAGRRGDPDDAEVVRQVLELQGPYVQAVHQMFDAVDRQDRVDVLRLEGVHVDPGFGVIDAVIEYEADRHGAAALLSLDSLSRLERFTARATPAVFLAALLLVTGFGLVLRRVRRLLAVQHQQALHDSRHDRLTGLPNRVLLAERVDQALRRQVSGAGAVGMLLIDLDRFKEINDTLGHHHGDQLLTQVGPRIRAVVRDVDTVARLGGDEFAVLLPGVVGTEAAVAVAEGIRAALHEHFVVEGAVLDVEASIGVVLSGEHGADITTLLQRADVAMYVAKKQGLGVFAYDADADAHSPERLALLGDLRRALDRDELFLHYQPKVSLATGEPVGVEALLRWAHPHRGLVMPDRFIPLAEHTGLIAPLTHHVLDLSLGQVRRWLDAGLRIPVAVNLSARNLLDERLPDQVAALLERHGVTADLLELEVTESAITTDPERAVQLLTRLAGLGVQIAIDDFGAGYTSLAQLTSTPVSQLKVDRSFVMTMDTDPAKAMIVRSIVDLGHSLGLVTVAEGVESAAAAELLRGYGCNMAQGYYFCRPGPPESLLAWHAAQQPAEQS
jgi:diguanylate cyclase